MRIVKVLSALALFLIACQTICGLHLAANPSVTPDGGNGFHLALGISILAIVLASTISVFRAGRRTG